MPKIEPEVTIIIGTGPNLIKASLSKELGPRFSKALIVGIQAEKTVRITQLLMTGRPKIYPVRIAKQHYENITVKMYYFAALAGGTVSTCPDIGKTVTHWCKNWLAGVDWRYNGILEFYDTCLVIELEKSPGPLTLSILGKGINKQVKWPKAEEPMRKEQEHDD